jgi:hypothetical protein
VVGNPVTLTDPTGHGWNIGDFFAGIASLGQMYATAFAGSSGLGGPVGDTGWSSTASQPATLGSSRETNVQGGLQLELHSARGIEMEGNEGVSGGDTVSDSTNPLTVYESPWILRLIVPGQVALDRTMTSWLNDDYIGAGLGSVAVLGEQVLTVQTIAQRPLQESATGLSNYIESNWFRYESTGKWSTRGVPQSGRHFHLDPLPGSDRLMRFHLPNQLDTWWGELKSLVRRWW